jgi:hypothetical protein
MATHTIVPTEEPGRLQLVQEALTHLRRARRLLRLAHAKRAASAARSALKSAEGAERHAINLETRERFPA